LVCLCGLAAFFLTENVSIAQQQPAPLQPVEAQRQFSSPEQAIAELRVAAQSRNDAAMHQIFGPDFDSVQTGDKTQDAINAEEFDAAVVQGCYPVLQGQNRETLEIGTNGWGLPIPLVKANGLWYFDTAVGKAEIIARHIAQDELHAVGFCRTYVKAQEKYALMDAGQDASYAMKFRSSMGQKDGLYWPATLDESPSPLGPDIAGSLADGYIQSMGQGPTPFHGYVFRILTRQGAASPGGSKDYMSQGLLSGGFGLVAYPSQWGRSGKMTFIVNQDGNVYERNLGEQTAEIARTMVSYNPEAEWNLVQDEGISDVLSQK